MTFLRIISLCLIFFVSSVNFCFSENEEFLPFLMDVQTISEQIFFSTLRIESEKINPRGESYTEVSTGFIVSYHLSDEERADFLVTSRHSVQGAFRGRFSFIKAREGKPSLGETYNIVVDNFENMWIYPEDKETDIAVMPLAGVVKQLEERNWQVYYRGVSYEMSLGSPGNAHFDAIEEIVLIGYPSGLIDTKNFIPVARRGITATPLNINYGGRHQFLIDATVFPGSSGSPVFIVNRGMYAEKDGTVKLGSRVVFLGMLSYLAKRREVGHIEIDGVSQSFPLVGTDQMLGIGVVYKAEAVFGLIRRVLSSR